MESRIQAVMARIEEIQARIGSLNRPETPRPEQAKPLALLSGAPLLPPAAGQTPFLSAANASNRPFDVALAQASGGVQLRPVGGIGAFTPDVEDLILKHSALNGLSPDLVRAVIQQESGGNPRAVSAVGAQGLMQLMPPTARGYGVTDPFDPEQNIAAGARHLAGMLRSFDGDMERALAAYNAGAARVRKYGGVPPFAETQQYVRKIMGMLGR